MTESSRDRHRSCSDAELRSGIAKYDFVAQAASSGPAKAARSFSVFLPCNLLIID